jgi:hypothetical protein
MPIRKSYLDLIPQTTAPTAVEGRIYYDANDKKLKYYNGAEWVSV